MKQFEYMMVSAIEGPALDEILTIHGKEGWEAWARRDVAVVDYGVHSVRAFVSLKRELDAVKPPRPPATKGVKSDST